MYPFIRKLSMWGFLVGYLYEHMFSLLSETNDPLSLLEICQQYNQLLYLLNDLVKLENNLITWQYTKTYIILSCNLSLKFDLIDIYHEELILLQYLGLLEAQFTSFLGYNAHASSLNLYFSGNIIDPTKILRVETLVSS